MLCIVDYRLHYFVLLWLRCYLVLCCVCLFLWMTNCCKQLDTLLLISTFCQFVEYRYNHAITLYFRAWRMYICIHILTYNPTHFTCPCVIGSTETMYWVWVWSGTAGPGPALQLSTSGWVYLHGRPGLLPCPEASHQWSGPPQPHRDTQYWWYRPLQRKWVLCVVDNTTGAPQAMSKSHPQQCTAFSYLIFFVPVASLSSIILYVLASVLCQHIGNCLYWHSFNWMCWYQSVYVHATILSVPLSDKVDWCMRVFLAQFITWTVSNCDTLYQKRVLINEMPWCPKG